MTKHKSCAGCLHGMYQHDGGICQLCGEDSKNFKWGTYNYLKKEIESMDEIQKKQSLLIRKYRKYICKSCSRYIAISETHPKEFVNCKLSLESKCVIDLEERSGI